LQSSLKDNQAIKRINIVQSGSVVEKKELDQTWDIIHNAIIKAANQTLPRKKVLNTGCSRKKSRTKTDLEKSILDLGKVIRNIRDNKTSQSNISIIDSANNTILNINRTLDIEIDTIQAQNLDEGEQDLRGWKKILEKNAY
ncbi:6232_t:CDS:1, partial [Gigaspora rosea]